jgi:hypothetical protein
MLIIARYIVWERKWGVCDSSRQSKLLVDRLPSIVQVRQALC